MHPDFTRIERLFVGGQWIAPSAGFEEVLNPATENVIGRAPVAGKADAEAALAAARHAFDQGPWPRMSFAERVEVMRRFRAGIVERAARIKALLTAEVGAVQMLMDSAQFQGALQALDYCIEQALLLRDEPGEIELRPNPFMPGTDIAASGVTVHEPYGVVAAITAYNYPFLINMTKLAPALLAGNAVVLKPSQFTPFSALLLGDIAEEAGLPAGVLNIVTGGPDVGAMLTSDPRVDLVSFTGSDAVGAAIQAQAAATLKKVHLELGGKSALIVRPDANLQLAAGIAAFNFTLHAGQGCALLTRFIVHNAVRAAFVETVKAIVGSLKLGDPADPSVIVGPLIREVARQKTERFVKAGLAEGARLVIGGRRPPHLERGFFYEPTLFDDVDNRSSLAQQEVFGPVGCVIGFDSDDEAVRLANDSRFGLNGGIVSADRGAALRIARRLRTGGVGINGGIGDLSVRQPFGGYKRSGIGRESGTEAIKEYLQTKTVWISTDLDVPNPFIRR